jgi:hypothetical protein
MSAEICVLSTIVATEFREAEKLEEELSKLRESVSTQEHRFENNLNAFNDAQSRKKELEVKIMNLLERGTLEQARLRQATIDFKKALPIDLLVTEAYVFNHKKNKLYLEMTDLHDRVGKFIVHQKSFCLNNNKSRLMNDAEESMKTLLTIENEVSVINCAQEKAIESLNKISSALLVNAMNLAQCKHKKEELQVKLRQDAELLQEQNEKLEEAASEHAKIEQDAADIQRKIMTQNNNLATKLFNLTCTIDSFKSECETWSSKVCEFEAKVESSKERIAENQTQIKDFITLSERLSSEICSLNGQILVLMQEISVLRSSKEAHLMKTSNYARMTLNTSYSNIFEQINSLKSRIKELSEESLKLQNEVTHIF